MAYLFIYLPVTNDKKGFQRDIGFNFELSPKYILALIFKIYISVFPSTVIYRYGY